MKSLNPLQLREVFHVEFLRWLARKVKVQNYCLKGGANLRFFFQSIRYSEDMDMDAVGISRRVLLEAAAAILSSGAFANSLKAFGIDAVRPPDISKAKPTETTQRLKVHLISAAGEDLFTKVEFSHRGLKGKSAVEPISDNILRPYMLAPLLVPHYSLEATIGQKIGALVTRKAPQARDIFDLYTLSSQCNPQKARFSQLKGARLAKAHERIFGIDFRQFRDAVVAYLALEDQHVYDNSQMWDTIRFKVIDFLEAMTGKK